MSGLRAAPYNPRRISDRALSGLRASIERFGLVEPVVWNERTGHVVGGHQRIRVLTERGDRETPVVVVDLPEAEEKALNVALNHPGISGEFTDDLAAVLADVRDALPELYDDLLLGELEAELRPTKADPDDVPEAPAEADCYVHRGDLWQLGSHRLLCGDSTQSADVERLMGGERAALMCTDPPYGVDYATAKWEGGIKNDGADGAVLQTFLEECFRTAVAFAVQPNAAWYLWHAQLTQGFFAAAAAAANLVLHRQIIWVKPSLILGHGDYHWRHELCFYGWQQGNRPPFYGERNQTTVWEMKNETSAGKRQHPTQKPVALWEAPIANHTRAGEVLYEPFSGSGSQLIAAEQFGRRCFAMELEPKYVQVAIERWQNVTGRKAVRDGSS